MKKIITRIAMTAVLLSLTVMALSASASSANEGAITLVQKDPITFVVVSGGQTANVTYSTDANGKFSATGVPSGYTLVYYPDTGTYTGEVWPVVGKSITNLPMAGDTNSPGAKLWAIPNADISPTINADGSQTLNWSDASNFLFETSLITYTAQPITHTQKNITTWVPIIPGQNADVTISTVNDTFHATGVPDGYTLVYYPNVGTYSNYTGEVWPVEGTNMTLPMTNDLNGGSSSDYCTNTFNPNAGSNCEGAKLWLVPTTDISTTPNTDGSHTLVGDWNTIAPNFLFETNLINYTASPISASVVTGPATVITSSDATLNGTNGPVAADQESFWVSTTTIDTSSSNIPAGVYSTPALSPAVADGTFSDLLSLVTTNGITTGGVPGNMPAITPSTTYYFVAWSHVGGTWYPGAVLNFTTSSGNETPTTYTLTYTAGTGGTITGVASQTVNNGANGTEVTAVPATGYHFVSWSDNNSTTNTRTDSDVTANVTATANFAINTIILVSNLQPSWTTPGGGGVYAAYYAPDSATNPGISPGTTAVFSGREAGIIKAGITPEPSGSNAGQYMDEGLLGFQVNDVDLSTFASQTLTYDVQNQTGTNPVWVRIRLTDTNQTEYQFVPSPYLAGTWNTVNAAAGQWQLMDSNGNGTGSMMTLAQVAAANPGLNVDRVYLTLGIGNSYNVSPGVGTVAWVDTVTIGGTTYNFVTAPTNVTVTIEKYIDGVPASTTPATAAFQMEQAYTIDSAPGSNPYTLSPSGAGSSNVPYEAVTSPLDAGSTYTTNEVVGGDSIVGTDCNANQLFSLVGYSSGTTLAGAVAATQSLTPPSFTNLSQNEYVIVWNHNCSTITGTVTGGTSPQGVLDVTSVTPVMTSGTAGGGYDGGWSYIFNITVPTNETNLAMKFSDWLYGAYSIPAGGNMQISSLQADNNDAPIAIPAGDAWSTPTLHMTGDLSPSTPGLQVQVDVQVQIPAGSVNGPYTTTYGVQTQ